MPALIGVTLALSVGAFAHLTRMDRDRAFYAAVLIVVATYYILFAAMSGDGSVIATESLLATGFLAAAAIGFRRSPWIIAIGLAAHGIFDAMHHHLVNNSAVPSWWPAFCLSYDVAAALVLAWTLARAPRASTVRQ